MADTFGAVLSDKLGTITLTDVARKMAGKSAKPRNVLSSLSRFRNDDRTPSQKKVAEIAGALGSLHKLSRSDSEQLRSVLLRAAGHGDPRFSDLRTAAKLDRSESETRRCLRPECEKILRRNGYSQEQVDRILSAAGASTMKLIIKAHKDGEDIEVVELGKLGETPQRLSEKSASKQETGREQLNTVIEAGRARITVSGELSPAQMKVLRNAADIIESVLKL